MKRNILFLVVGVMVGAIMATGVTTWAVNQQVRLFVDGKEIVFADAPPQMINGRTMVPARPLAEALGATVAWDGETQSVVVTKITVASVPDSLKPFVIKVRRGGQAYPGSAIFDEAGELRLSLRTVGAVQGKDVLLIDTTIKIGEVAIDRSEVTRVDDDLYVRLSLVETRLDWQATMDRASNTLTVE